MSSIYSEWEQSLRTQGYAQCVHPECQLSFLSLAGVVFHHKTCPGWTKPENYLPCMHCGVRWPHHRAYQAHVQRNHKHLLEEMDQQDLYQSSDVPDVVPRKSTHQHSKVTSTITLPSDQYSDGYSIFAEKEQILSEREMEVTQLEALVQQMEVKAEQARKARELAMWEESLQRREEMARMRMAEAERLIQEHSVLAEMSPDEHNISVPMVSPTSNPNPHKSVILPKSMALSPTESTNLPPSNLSQLKSDASNIHPNNPTLHKQLIPPTLNMSPIPTTTPSYIPSNPSTGPIVVPSNIKLPPSAIKLTP